jgi:RNA polymerase sigma-70 factor (ECF subfamily)
MRFWQAFAATNPSKPPRPNGPGTGRRSSRRGETRKVRPHRMTRLTMPASLNAIYLDQRHSLLGRAMRVLRNLHSAEDVLQESYLRVHKAAETGSIDNMGAFLHRTVHNLALDHLRRRRTRERFEISPPETVESLEIASESPSAEDHLLYRERLNNFKGALATLPERARKVWVLNRVEGWSYPRIAEHLGISQGTVFNDMKLAMGHVLATLSRAERD